MSEFDVLRPLPKDYDWHGHEDRVPELRDRLTATRPPENLTSHRQGAEAYRPDDDLILAVNAAIHLRAPLLVTGDPGTGKTQLAYFLGLYFGIELFPYTVRSTSTAKDLRYDFDAVAYLREAYLAQAGRTEPGQAGQPSDAQTAQGRTPADQPAVPAPRRAADADPRMRHIEPGPLWRAFDHQAQCLVLIDEIDKAPRDFPNDLLQELDKQEFPHPFSTREADKISADRAHLPLVLVTSNNERRLPDAFLRRCIVHHIEMTPELIKTAVAAHAQPAFAALGQPVRDAAIARFRELRREQRLARRPGIAELLAWLVTLARARPDIGADELARTPLAALPHLHCLVKLQEDLDLLREPGRR
jgi:MoxR-like ATPase